MEIRENDKVFILAPLASKLGKKESSRIFESIESESRDIALDLSYAQDCSLEFIEQLKCFAEKKCINIFNIPSDMFVIFNVMNIDKIAKFYVNELDFLTNKRQIINRNFIVV